MANANVNKVILVGNLGHNPELRYTSKGNAVLSFSLATTRDFKLANGDKKEETYWHRATVWGKRAEVCNTHLQKGSRVFIEGILQSKSWTDKEGHSHKSSEILVEDIKFLGGKPRGETLPSMPLEASVEISPEQ